MTPEPTTTHSNYESLDPTSHQFGDNGTDLSQALREQTGALRDDLKALSRTARQATADKLGEARDTASKALRKGKVESTRLKRNVHRQVRERPVGAMLVAGGLGLLAGFMWARR